MATKKVTQMIEKERQSDAPIGFWRSEASSKQKTEEISVYNNFLIRTENRVTSSDRNFKSERTVVDNSPAFDSIFRRDLDEDANNVAKGNMFCYELDETDYFDSEDEYWDNLRNKEIREELCPHCHSYHLPRSIHDYAACTFSEVYDMYPAFTPLVQAFAKENNFEIYDVYEDELCVYRAVSDQFMINGCLGHTELSLHETVIEHLRRNPSNYGIHDSAFFSEDTWEMSLKRIDKTRQWGVNTILQALADIFLLQISIFYFGLNDIRDSIITSERTEDVLTKKIHIFLGHIGELHSFSLRPLKWQTALPYKSQILRLLVTCTEKNEEERKQILDRRLASLSRGHFPVSNLTEYVQFVSQYISFHEARRAQRSKHTYFEQIFKSYSGSDLQMEESEDIRRKLLEDQLEVDPLSGIHLYHLSFIVKHIFPYKMFQGDYMTYHIFMIGTCKMYYHYLGSFADHSCLMLRDISRAQKMHRLRIKKRNSRNKTRVAVLKMDVVAVYGNDLDLVNGESMPGHVHVLVDLSNTHPGYCRLRHLSSMQFDTDDNVLKIGSEIYQKAYRVTDRLRSEVDVEYLRKLHCIGIPCYTFPFGRRWGERKEKSDFPSRKLIASIIRTGCTLIPKHHPRSSCPDAEWQFNFSMAENLIFKSFTVAQRHGFLVLKVLLENMLNHSSFKTKHLKSVFLMACEEMPSSVWETNFCGCLLFVLGSLLSCLKAKFLPNYFIPENNLIDCHNEDDVNTMCTIVEYIRFFPANVIQIVAEKYGYTYGSNLIKYILSNVKYSIDKTSVLASFHDQVGPLTISTATILAKMGFYSISLDLLEDRFEQSLLIPQTEMRQTSYSFRDFLVSALMEMKQKASRVLLARTFDMIMGSNVADMILEKQEISLQMYLPWPIDLRLSWIKFPSSDSNDLTTVANFLYEYSKREYWRRNKVLAELAINTAIQCIQETLKEDNLNDVRKRMLKRKLIVFYVHVYCVSTMNWNVSPLIYHMEEIENLCTEFPEMTTVVSLMFRYTNQPEKSRKYGEMSRLDVSGRDSDLALESSPKSI